MIYIWASISEAQVRNAKVDHPEDALGASTLHIASNRSKFIKQVHLEADTPLLPIAILVDQPKLLKQSKALVDFVDAGKRMGLTICFCDEEET